MDRKIAGLLLLAVSALLAILLGVDAVSPVVGGVIFAVCLVSLGILSGGFRK